MFNFILRNKKQFAFVVLFNLFSLVFLTVLFNMYVNYVDDYYIVVMSMFLGVMATRLTVILLKQNKKELAIRIILFVIVFMIVITYISSLFLDPEDVLLIPAMLIGLLSYLYMDHTVDTVKNIIKKSRINLDNLDKK